MNVKRYAACVVALATIAVPPLLAAPPTRCAPPRADVANMTAGVATRDAQTVDADRTMAAIDAMGGVGRAAPNAEAQAALDAITNLMAGRPDADSQAAAAMMRKYAASPGGTTPPPPKRVRIIAGC